MAVYFEQYNPWREQLAGSILAPLLKAALGRWQEAEQNRKENAFLGEAMKEFQPPVDTSMPVLQDFQGPRSSNPWEQAAGDAGLMQGFDPSFAAQAMQPQARSMQDIQARLGELQSSPRFSMLNPDRTRQLLAPMMEQYAAAENARQMQDFFAQFGEKRTPFERLVHMARGAVANYLPDNVVTNYVDLYKHQNPHKDFKLVDSGDKVTGYSFDPGEGTVSEVLNQMVGLNPYQAGNLANERSRIGISAGQLGLARERFDWEKTHGGIGGGAGGMPYQFLQDPSGNFVVGNKRTGDLEPTDVKGLVKGNPYERMSERDKIQLQSLMRQKEGIIRDAATIGYGPNTQAVLDDIEQRIQELLPGGEDAATAALNGQRPQGGRPAPRQGKGKTGEGEGWYDTVSGTFRF